MLVRWTVTDLSAILTVYQHGIGLLLPAVQVLMFTKCFFARFFMSMVCERLQFCMRFFCIIDRLLKFFHPKSLYLIVLILRSLSQNVLHNLAINHSWRVKNEKGLSASTSSFILMHIHKHTQTRIPSGWHHCQTSLLCTLPATPYKLLALPSPSAIFPCESWHCTP